MTPTPAVSYGVRDQTAVISGIDRAAEEVARLGYCIFDPGFSTETVEGIARQFDRAQARYIGLHGYEFLKARDEHNTVRLPLTLDPAFLDLARAPRLLELVSRLIAGKFILNQQNGIVNPAGDRYNQDAWHRDLPYQHFTSSRPLAINALYCVDEFTEDNGATFVLPATHLQQDFPSDAFIGRHALQVAAAAGSFIVVDCMTYHRGGRNRTNLPRRAVNHVFTIPFIKQQIAIPSAMTADGLDDTTRELLGWRYGVPGSVEDFLRARP